MTLQLPVPTHQFLIDGISLEKKNQEHQKNAYNRLSEVKTMKDVAVVWINQELVRERTSS